VIFALLFIIVFSLFVIVAKDNGIIHIYDYTPLGIWT